MHSSIDDNSGTAMSNVKHRRACVLGASLDVGNRGVLALGVSLAHLLARSSPWTDIVFHYGGAAGGTKRLTGIHTEVSVTIHNCRMSPKSRRGEHILVILCLALLHRLGIHGPAVRNAWLRALLQADLVGDIRGGDSFSDLYGFRRFLLGSLPLLSVALLGRPYVMLPQTYGPFRLRASRALATFILRRAATIHTRDRNCESLVAELCGRKPAFCPDVAFTLEPVAPTDLRFAPQDLQVAENELLIGVNVSGLLYMGGYNGRNMFGLRGDYRELVDRLIASLMTATNARVLLVPHVFESEHEEEATTDVLTRYAPRYPGRLFAITQPLNERELKWVIGRTDFFIGSRMHACIAALSQFVPTVGLAYSNKFLGVFESAGVGECIIDLRAVETADVVNGTLRALEKRSDVRRRLTSHIPEIQRAIVQAFREIASGL